jgi:hypothetical protein
MPRRYSHRYSGPIALFVAVVGAAIAGVHIFAGEYESGKNWPEPKIVTPGEHGSPPSDAIVLFDGKDWSQWEGGHWIIKNGTATSHGGDTRTKQMFGPDYQLHVEWAEPEDVADKHGQGRGNSGVFLADRYEIQVLDSYDNTTYFDGQCAAVYKQWPPLVNACRKPGQWQTYDIMFESPRFDGSGKVLRPGYVTVFQNGIIVQNHSRILGSTAWDQGPKYEPHPPQQPIRLQWHGNPVRFRNIWVREVHPMVPKKA